MPARPEPATSFGRPDVAPENKKRLVHDLFSPLAATYDLTDTILSAGFDRRWRRRAIRLLGLRPGERVLDVCGGTAGLAVLAARAVRPGGRSVVYDFNAAMMEAGRRRARRSGAGEGVRFVGGDAEALGLAGASFDAATIGFGLRNLTRPELGLREILRVLKPGGRLMVLEFSVPAHSVVRALYHLYSFRVMPLLARVASGTSGPYRYLAESIRQFPPPDEVASLIRRAGFVGVNYLRLDDGIAVIYLGRKPSPENP
jgi:demethylmenaquinone methyltransferase / 2-methoxy-6-polyprenyl-1,4-benzoquinol methylase